MDTKRVIGYFTWLLRLKNGTIRQVVAGEVIWNVADTSDEEPPECDAGSWTTFWQRMTGCTIPLHCPVCGKLLTASNTKGAHVRFDGEPEDDMAWIVPLCSLCNNWKTVSKMTLSNNAYFARTKMSMEHKTHEGRNACTPMSTGF